jgi:hypothetical protein
VIGVARVERPGTDETICGVSALRALASIARRRPGSTAARAGLPKTRCATAPHCGQQAGSADAAIGLTNANVPHGAHE